MPRGKKPSEEKILEGIKKAWDDGEDLRYSAVTKGKNRWLQRSGLHYYATWGDLLLVADLSEEIVKERAEGPKREKRKKKLLRDLRAAYANGKGIDLSASAIQAKGNQNRGLYDRAHTHFKGRFFWHDALRAAKLPVEKIIRQGLWDKEKTKRELIARHKAHKPIYEAAVKEEDTPLYKACLHHHNNCYDDALRYAGFNPDEIRMHGKSMNKREIVLKVIELHLHGQDLNPTAIKNSPHSAVYWATRKFDNGYRELVELIGVDYPSLCERKKGYWTIKTVFQGIGQLLEKGERVNGGHVSVKYSDLYHAGYRLFPNRWNGALEEYGLNSREIYLAGKLVSITKVLNKIRTWHKQGRDLSPAGMTQYGDEESHVVYMRAMWEFNDWGKVLQEAGLPPDQIRRFLNYSLQRLVQAAKDLEASGINLEAQNVRKNFLAQWLFFEVIRHFDSWKQFLLKHVGVVSAVTEAVSLQNGDDVIKYLTTHFESGVVTESAVSENIRLIETAQEHFGGVPQAVNGAKMIYSPQGEITPAMLEDEKVIGALYRFNGKFARQLANQIIDAERIAGRVTPNHADLTFQTFVMILEVLPDKPPEIGLRGFCSKRVLEKLKLFIQPSDANAH